MNAPIRHILLILCLAATGCSRSDHTPAVTEGPATSSSSPAIAANGGSVKGAAAPNSEAPMDDGTIGGMTAKPEPPRATGKSIGAVAPGASMGPGDDDIDAPTTIDNAEVAARDLVRREETKKALEQAVDASTIARLRGLGGEGSTGFNGDGDGLLDGKLEEKPPPPPSGDRGVKDALEAALDKGWREGGADLSNKDGRFDDLQVRDGFEPRPAEVVVSKEEEFDEKPKVAGDAAKTDNDQEDARGPVKNDRSEGEATARPRDSWFSDLHGIARGTYTLRVTGEDPALFVPPATTLPRMFYFENTYLGGSAAYAERLRRLDAALGAEPRPYELVRAEAQPFDLPRTEGLAVSASVDASHFERARRVFLQIGLQGSARYGWRRPPLDVVLVLDRPALDRGLDATTDFVVELLRTLGPSDRIGLVVAGSDVPFLEVTRLTTAQQHLAHRIDSLEVPATQAPNDLAEAMRRAGAMLTAASDDEATVPGSKTVLVLTGDASGSPRDARVRAATAAAHELTVQGAVTSVFALGAEAGEWWQVANAGYGNLHHLGEPADLGARTRSFANAIGEELSSIARVVARLVRVNVRLGKDTKAIRVLGTRVLEQREVEDVKARELATDLNLSKSLGIVSDRGEDDDGIQTVIPYFYGDDSHVILVELWVEGPGVVADVTVRYKDMVNLDNATARTSVRLGTRPQPPTREQVLVARNARGFELAESLQAASDAVYRNDYGSAWTSLGAAAAAASETNAEDAQAVTTLKSLLEQRNWQGDAMRRATLTETLLISGQRRVGDTGTAARKR
jgi:hypothetical protein